MSHIRNIQNQYAAELGPLLDDCPKAVLAAVAVSLLSGGGDRLELVALQLAAEWSTLYENGIVPQKPRKVARALLKAGEP